GEHWASLNGGLVRLKTKSAVGDPVDGQLVPMIVYITGVPSPGWPKVKKHCQPSDERQRNYRGSKAMEQPRFIHPYKNHLQPGCQTPHKTYSGRLSGRVTARTSPIRALSPLSRRQLSPCTETEVRFR